MFDRLTCEGRTSDIPDQRLPRAVWNGLPEYLEDSCSFVIKSIPNPAAHYIDTECDCYALTVSANALY